MYHPVWLTYLVGVLFTLLICGGAAMVSLIYPLVGVAGSWTTVNRRKYPAPTWTNEPIPVHHG